jgi:hypothetical protein
MRPATTCDEIDGFPIRGRRRPGPHPQSSIASRTEFLIGVAIRCKSRESDRSEVCISNLLSLIDIERRTGNVTVSIRCDSPAATTGKSARDWQASNVGGYSSKFISFQRPFRSSTTSRIGKCRLHHPDRERAASDPAPVGAFRSSAAHVSCCGSTINTRSGGSPAR